MSERIEKITKELDQTAVDVASTFGSLTTAQLNWKPASKSWSIAQCLDHLITGHSLYFPLFERLASGEWKPDLWARTSPLSGLFGRFLVKGLDPKNRKKMKTTSKAYPSSSEIDAGIVERYVDHQRQMIEAIRRVPGSIDPWSTIVTSPLLAVVTYSLDDCYTILAEHGARHFDQAKRVMSEEGFPTTPIKKGI